MEKKRELPAEVMDIMDELSGKMTEQKVAGGAPEVVDISPPQEVSDLLDSKVKELDTPLLCLLHAFITAELECRGVKIAFTEE